jgi:hypothetical protein
MVSSLEDGLVLGRKIGERSPGGHGVSVGLEEVVVQARISTSLRDTATRQTLEWELRWLCRLALGVEFIGHWAFGVMTKQAWVPHMTLFRFPEAWGWRLMAVVGSLDIALGLLALLAPTRATCA